MQEYGDNFIPIIPMEDDRLHTENKRFCGDPTCECSEEPALINSVNQEFLDGLLTETEATRTIQGRQI
jgi:hypothetical protein